MDRFDIEEITFCMQDLCQRKNALKERRFELCMILTACRYCNERIKDALQNNLPVKEFLEELRQIKEDLRIARLDCAAIKVGIDQLSKHIAFLIDGFPPSVIPKACVTLVRKKG